MSPTDPWLNASPPLLPCSSTFLPLQGYNPQRADVRRNQKHNHGASLLHAPNAGLPQSHQIRYKCSARYRGSCAVPARQPPLLLVLCLHLLCVHVSQIDWKAIDPKVQAKKMTTSSSLLEYYFNENAVGSCIALRKTSDLYKYCVEYFLFEISVICSPLCFF